MRTFREEVRHEILVAARANPVFVTVGPAQVEVGPRGVFITYHGCAYTAVQTYAQRFSLTTTEFSFSAYDDLVQNCSIFEFTEFVSLVPAPQLEAGWVSTGYIPTNAVLQNADFSSNSWTMPAVTCVVSGGGGGGAYPSPTPEALGVSLCARKKLLLLL